MAIDETTANEWSARRKWYSKPPRINNKLLTWLPFGSYSKIAKKYALELAYCSRFRALSPLSTLRILPMQSSLEKFPCLSAHNPFRTLTLQVQFRPWLLGSSVIKYYHHHRSNQQEEKKRRRGHGLTLGLDFSHVHTFRCILVQLTVPSPASFIFKHLKDDTWWILSS